MAAGTIIFAVYLIAATAAMVLIAVQAVFSIRKSIKDEREVKAAMARVGEVLNEMEKSITARVGAIEETYGKEEQGNEESLS